MSDLIEDVHRALENYTMPVTLGGRILDALKAAKEIRCTCYYPEVFGRHGNGCPKVRFEAALRGGD